MKSAVRSRLLLTALAAGLCAASTAAQFQVPRTPDDPQRAIRQGTHAFRRIIYESLRDHDLTPLRQLDDLTVVPEKTLLIILGRAQLQLPVTVASFVERGGAVLFATDRRARLSGTFNVEITGGRAKLPPTSRERGYRELAECPFVQPMPGATTPIFLGLDGAPLSRVATNVPSVLVYSEERLSSLPLLAALVPGCQEFNEEGKLVPRILLPFAAGGVWGHGPQKGRILVLADHSVFINDMLCQDDLQNFQFAFNCLNWLSERDDGSRRNRVLLLEEGEIQSKFDVQPGESPRPKAPPLGKTLQILNEALYGLEEEDTFNRILLDKLDQVPSQRMLQGAVVGLTVLLALYALTRLGLARHQVEPGTPSLEKALMAAAVIEHRPVHLPTSGAARGEARAWFEAALGPDLAAVRRRQELGQRPLFRVRTRDGWWQRWRLGRRVRRLWRLAQDTALRPRNEPNLVRLRTELERLDAALERGLLRFEVPKR